MRIIETKAYTFDELSDEAKEKAIENLYDINFYHDWWDCVYDDAKQIGCKINGFDIYHRSIDFSLDWDINEVIDAILKNHGEKCETYKIALDYRQQWDDLVSQYSDGINTDIVAEDNEYDFDRDADDLTDEFTKELAEEYLSILNEEYQYRSSEEAIIEAILANEYEFTEDGKLI